MWTLAMYPYMGHTLRAVSRLFKYTVDRQPLPRVHFPELSKVADIKKVNLRNHGYKTNVERNSHPTA